MTPTQFNAVQFNAALFGGGGTSAGPLIQVGQGLLYPALRKAGVTLGPGRTPSPAQFQDAIDELNRLTGSLNCDRLFIYSHGEAVWPLDGRKAYTIGPDPAADFEAPRPQMIEQANVIMQPGSYRRPLALATDQQWSKIAVQDIPNAVPQVLYNDRASPVSTLYLWGQPFPGYQLELFTWTPVQYFSNLTDVLTAPAQYVDCLVLNLAVRLVTHFPNNANVPRQVDPNLYQQARESLMRLESINAPQPVAYTGGLCNSTGGYNNYNVYTDTWGRWGR